MDKSFVWVVTACVGIALCVSCAGPEEKAGKLLAEASQFVQSSREAEKTSYANAFELYQKALAEAETITAQYPSTQLAGRLAQGEAKIGPYALTELRDTIVPRAQMKSEAEENPLACALLVARTVEDRTSRASVVTDIATGYADAGQFDRALQILKTTRDKESRNRVLSEMISSHLYRNLYDQAVRIANAVADDTTLKDWALAWIARDAANRGQYDKAGEVANMLEVAEAKAEALLNVASACINAGQREQATEIVSHALAIAKTIGDPARKDWVLGQVAREYSAVDLYAQALEAAEKLMNPEEKTEILLEIARNDMKAGHYDQAIKVAHMITDASAQYRALADVANAYIASGDKAKTRDLLTYLLQVADAIKERPPLTGRLGRPLPGRRSPIEAMQSRPVKAKALAEVASKYGKIGDQGQAEELLRQAVAAIATTEDPMRKANAQLEVAQVYAELGQFDQAMQTAEAIENTYFKGKALVTIAGNYAQAGRFEHALQVAEAIPEDGSGLRSDALAVIVHHYIEAGQLDQAQRLAETISDYRVRQGVLNEVAEAYKKAGQEEKATNLLSQVEEDDRSDDGRWEERYALMVGMVAHYAQAGLYDPALQMANLLEAGGEKAGMLATVARRVAEAGQKEKAVEILAQALEAAKAVEGKTDPDLSALPGIALQDADLGQCQQAAEAATIIRDAQSKEQTMAEIARKCATGQREKATTTAEKTKPTITNAQAKMSQYDQDLQLARAMEDTPAKAEALLAVAHKYAEAGVEEKATEISIQALRITNSVEDNSEEGEEMAGVRAEILSHVAGKYLEVGQYDQALMIAKTMKDDIPKAGVLAEVASKYAEAGVQEKAAELLSQALQIAKTRQGAEARAQALTAVGFPYAKAGLKVDDQAKKILHDMVAELSESIWREQPPEAEEQKPGRRGVWGMVGAEGNP